MSHKVLFVGIALSLLAACSAEDPPAAAPEPTTPALEAAGNAAPLDRGLEFGRVITGGKLFEQYCASCHGTRAEGDPGWQRRDAQGRFPPPPLDGTGHAWHHSRDVLKDVILNGTLAQGGGMPAWRGKLSDDEIDAIIDWIQSRWPEEVYRTWRQANPPQQ
ncbi:MAG TPA: cytochrome c [Gammaproteobacteria bacterium]|nr:cytochrome c [Gammaproteobacteria bacterium]